MKTIVISGLSGAGKTSAVKMLEDLGYYCVDNLPVTLLPPIFDLSTQSVESIQKMAVVVDARDKENIEDLPGVLQRLQERGFDLEVLFFDASDETLARRFSETRHRHPLAPDRSALVGIREERKLLAAVREIADQVIETSVFSPKDLRDKLRARYSEAHESLKLAVKVSSFGFKYGLPIDADLVLDVRFLLNPFFKSDLKMKNGLHGDVVEYVLKQNDASLFFKEAERFLGFLIPRFAREGKSYLHVAIGCTGGRHRSVVVTQEVAKMIRELGYEVSEEHRDMERQ